MLGNWWINILPIKHGNIYSFSRRYRRDTAIQKFSQFIDTNSLNSVQSEYLKSILDYVSVNGDINGQVLVNKEPFSEFDWIKVYGQDTAKVKKVIFMRWKQHNYVFINTRNKFYRIRKNIY